MFIRFCFSSSVGHSGNPCFCFSSSVGIRGTHNAHNFRHPRSAIVACTSSHETALLFAICFQETRRFSLSFHQRDFGEPLRLLSISPSALLVIQAGMSAVCIVEHAVQRRKLLLSTQSTHKQRPLANEC
jgi:hypothetical protein